MRSLCTSISPGMEKIFPRKKSLSERVFDKGKGDEDETESGCVGMCAASLHLMCIWCVLLSGPNEEVHV